MKIRNTLLAIVALFLFSGCSILGGGEELTIQQKAVLLKATTQTATALGLGQIEDVDDRTAISAKIVLISNEIVKTLDGRGLELNGSSVLSLLDNLVPPEDIAEIPPEVRVTMQSVLDVLLAGVRVPQPAELLDADTLLLIREAVVGIGAGAHVHITEPVQMTNGGVIYILYPLGITGGTFIIDNLPREETP